MPTGKFADQQPLRTAAPRGVNATGPLDADADVKEMCVWFVQHPASTVGSGADAAATEMTTSTDGEEQFDQTPLGDPNRIWTLPANTISDTPLRQGPALAWAIALVRDDSTGEEKVHLWGQTVMLV
jgi:hypothetical protein